MATASRSARQVTGTAAVRSIVILDPNTPPPPTPSRCQTDPDPADGEIRTRQMGCAGYQEALAAAQGTRVERRGDPEVAAAVERQTKAMRELSARVFAAQAEVPAPIAEARLQRRRQAAAVEEAALRRARVERAARRGRTAGLVEQPVAWRLTA